MLIFIEMQQPSDDDKLLKGIFFGETFSILLYVVFARKMLLFSALCCSR